MKVSNPLTIIAIFAGLAETLATVALIQLPFKLQLLFIYFVMAFPASIVIFFFVVLYFKNNVLYAPSDFPEPAHYLEAIRLGKSIGDEVESVLSKSAFDGTQENKHAKILNKDAESKEMALFAMAEKATEVGNAILDDLLSPVTKLLVLQLLEKPVDERVKIINGVESERAREMLNSVMGNIEVLLGTEVYNRPIRPSSKG